MHFTIIMQGFEHFSSHSVLCFIGLRRFIERFVLAFVPNLFSVMIEDRLTSGPYWYGADWSAMDAYLYWIYWRVEGANFDVTPYPHFTAHARQMEQRQSVIRALAIEKQALETLTKEGLNFAPPSFSD